MSLCSPFTLLNNYLHVCLQCFDLISAKIQQHKLFAVHTKFNFSRVHFLMIFRIPTTYREQLLMLLHEVEVQFEIQMC